MGVLIGKLVDVVEVCWCVGLKFVFSFGNSDVWLVCMKVCVCVMCVVVVVSVGLVLVVCVLSLLSVGLLKIFYYVLLVGRVGLVVFYLFCLFVVSGVLVVCVDGVVFLKVLGVLMFGFL